MTDLDEAVLRELLHRGTSDVHASPALARSVVSRERRRHRRNRMAGLAVTGVAAGAAVAVVATSAPHEPAHESAASPSPTPTNSASSPAIRLTAAQLTLYRLSTRAAAAQGQRGRYVVLKERQGNSSPDNQSSIEKISVIDSRTGDIWTYQRGVGPKDKNGGTEPVPTQLPVDRHGSPTEAEFRAMPTDPAALRAALLAQAERQSAQDSASVSPPPSAAISAQASAAGSGSAAATSSPASPAGDQESDDDTVYEAASDLLWEPLVPPALRAALFKVLATTPGVVVRKNARDSSGHRAIAISRDNRSTGVEDGITNYEDPATSAVLEQDFGPARHPFAGGYDRYQSRTWTDTFPGNPYRNK